METSVVEQSSSDSNPLQTAAKRIVVYSMIGGLLGIILNLIPMLTTAASTTEHSRPISIFGIVTAFVFIGVTILLYIAACQDNNPMLLLPWLIYQALLLPLLTACCLILIVMAIAGHDVRIFALIIILLRILVNAYCTWIILIYYRALKEKRNSKNNAQLESPDPGNDNLAVDISIIR
ncbi:hypothetical protein DAPPUDRAFT_300229 [Daphnia pulex]|uniref:Uncharacterized protein n=1 Tax=Daphnia pulex TaxID=6669 RepID=E9G5G9_DAPPU|nr:hypothetical protein DAPPUDRAFT_300229 [Daphnia pulex]|eukprot:EFX85206.1 hypothetical protein DAPPUDRAFT_300229 [Daphnia pulex]